MRCAAPARSPASRPGPATSPCSTRRAARDSRAIDVTATITDASRDLPGRGQRRRLDRDLHRRRPAPRCRARRGRWSCPISTSRCAAAATIAAKQVGQVALNFAAGEPARLDPRPGDASASTAAPRRLPANVRADPHPSAQGRRGRSGDRSAGRSGGPRGGRQRDLRASRRLPADRRTSSSTTRRARTSPQVALTRASGAAKARRVTGGSASGMAARESSSA